MSIESLAQASPRTSQVAVNNEALKIAAAIEHIKAHGNLDGFPASRGERLALVSTAGRQGLIAWNRSRARYELTSRGHRHVRFNRRAAGVERHQGAYGKGSGDRSDQAFDALLIPNPTALKIRQLKSAAMAVLEKVVEVNRVCLKG